MSEASKRQVVVIGGGITGLTAAYRINRARPDVSVTLLERRGRLGGNIITERRDGFLLDGGPDSFLRTKPEAVALCKELGLETDLITTRDTGRNVYIVHGGHLERMPGGMALAVPTRVGPMITTSILSMAGKLRMLGDVLMPGESNEDESIESFISRRFGHEAAMRIAAPLLGGIYAGDIAELSVRSTFPQLVDLEQAHGSLVRGLFAAQRARSGAPPPGGGWKGARELLGWLRRESETAQSPFYSLRGGMGSLVDELATALPAGAARTQADVKRVAMDGERWRVELGSGQVLDADALVLATPAHVAAALVPDASLGSELDAIPYVSTATVFFALPRHAVAHPLDGVGFIVPPGEARILAGTWVSSKWEGRAPDGHVLIRAFVGGAEARGSIRVKGATDEQIVDTAKNELERLMGPIGAPLFARVFRYEDSNPQPVVGHGARLARIAERLGSVPGLYLAGAPYDGVGIPDCVKQAESVAARVVNERC